MKIAPKVCILIEKVGSKETQIFIEKDFENNEIYISYGPHVNQYKVKENTQKIFDLIKEMLEL